MFGDADPINKMVRYNNQHDLKVTGLLKDIPSNSTLQFNFVVPFSYLESSEPEHERTASPVLTTMDSSYL